jgi:hypothetical protein
LAELIESIALHLDGLVVSKFDCLMDWFYPWVADFQKSRMSFEWYQIGIRRNSDSTKTSSDPTLDFQVDWIEKFYVRVPLGTRILDAIQDYDSNIAAGQIVSIRLCPVCIGCIENQPNQLAHMGTDGCLEQWDHLNV